MLQRNSFTLLLLILYRFPLREINKKKLKLVLKNMDLNKFFWYDQNECNIEKILSSLSKANIYRWPMDDEHELRIRRICSSTAPEMSINYNIQPTREFSCATGIIVSCWGVFINSTGTSIRLNDLSNDAEVIIKSNEIAMVGSIKHSFTLAVPYGSGWVASLPIYLVALSGRREQHYVLPETTSTTSLGGNASNGVEIVIQSNYEIYKFVLQLQVEDERRILKLQPKFVVVNFSKNKLCLIPFALDHKEKMEPAELQVLNDNLLKESVEPVSDQDRWYVRSDSNILRPNSSNQFLFAN